MTKEQLQKDFPFLEWKGLNVIPNMFKGYYGDCHIITIFDDHFMLPSFYPFNWIKIFSSSDFTENEKKFIFSSGCQYEYKLHINFVQKIFKKFIINYKKYYINECIKEIENEFQ